MTFLQSACALLCLLVVCEANINQGVKKSDASWDSSSTLVDSGFTSSQPYTYSSAPVSQPYTYSSGSALYSSDASGFGVQQSLFSGDLLGAGLSFVFGLFALSLVLQIAGNLINLPMFDDLIPATGRSLDPEDLVSYARLAADAYSKYQQLNNDVPK